jgi:hypothetical protein
VNAYRRREIVRLNCLWYDSEDQPWLVIFELAELDGRTECVGMSIRSYLGLPVPDPDEPVYGATAWVEGAGFPDDVDDDDWSIDGDEEQRWLRSIVRSGLGAEEMSQPRRLLAATIREMRFAEVLEGARRREVTLLRAGVDAIRGTPTFPAQFKPGTMEHLAVQLEAEAASLDQPRTRSGRHKKYQRGDLERVASVYRKAFQAGSRSPTKDVAETLGLSRNQAAKLVMRCRDPQESLLAPTQKRRAGGTRPPVTEPGHPESSG